MDAILQAYDARLKNKQTQEQRWITYPYAELEKQRLEMCQKMIETAQALMEQVGAKTNDVTVIPTVQEIKPGNQEAKQDEEVRKRQRGKGLNQKLINHKL